MDIQDLFKIIQKGEDSYTQFKEKINSINSLAAEITAFANSYGGKIYRKGSENPLCLS